MSLAYEQPLIVMIYIVLYTVLGCCCCFFSSSPTWCDWSFIILSILFINILDSASCWYLIFMMHTHMSDYGKWQENGQLIKNPFCVCACQCWVMLLTNINRTGWLLIDKKTATAKCRLPNSIYQHEYSRSKCICIANGLVHQRFIQSWLNWDRMN